MLTCAHQSFCELYAEAVVWIRYQQLHTQENHKSKYSTVLVNRFSSLFKEISFSDQFIGFMKKKNIIN